MERSKFRCAAAIFLSIVLEGQNMSGINKFIHLVNDKLQKIHKLCWFYKVYWSGSKQREHIEAYV